jgi:hypothetical protein
LVVVGLGWQQESRYGGEKREKGEEREKGADMWAPRHVSSTLAKPLNKIVEWPNKVGWSKISGFEV